MAIALGELGSGSASGRLRAHCTVTAEVAVCGAGAADGEPALRRAAVLTGGDSSSMRELETLGERI